MASSNLPLHCNICPKKPNFSDVSHLLTHIASKGHLSHYYKVKVRSSTDRAAKQQIDIYDEWYARWNVEELMAERMHHKDKKRSRARGQASAAKPQKKKAKGNNGGAGILDPSLGHGPKGFASYETGQNFLSNSNILPFEPPPPTKLHRPKLHLWSTQTPSSYIATCVDYSSSPPILPSNSFSIQQGAHQSHAAYSAAPYTLDGGIDDEDEDVLAEAAKLKGIFWPGMDLFDSATPEMRKKRNQRKDGSVVEQLEQNSQVVEPTEMIFYQSGDLKKQRKISGRVESSESPTESPHPSPSLPQPSLRYPMANLDVNTSRLRGPPVATAQMATQYLPAQAVMSSTTNRRRKPHKSQSSAVTAPKRKRQFSVFQDKDDEDFGNPRGMTCLTSEFRYEPSESRAKTHQLQPHTQANHFTNETTIFNDRNQYQESFVPFQSYQAFYDPQQDDVYGDPGYDLATLLTRHLEQATNEAEYDEHQTNGRKRGVDRDSALTISDDSNP